MKVKEWIDQNYDLLNCDLYIEALKDGSYNLKDMILETYLSKDYARRIFGDFELMKIGVGKSMNSDHITIKLLIWINL